MTNFDSQGPVAVIIPAWNEEPTIGDVVSSLPRKHLRAIVVADNGSTDGTGRAAKAAGATVVEEPRRGYGQACLAGLAWCAEQTPSLTVIAFVDGDGSDHPDELARLIDPILEGRADLVIGSRIRGERERGALLPQARVGNWIASTWIRLVTGVPFTDLGPFRAVSVTALARIGMVDTNYGWTVEMQFKAAKAGLRCLEVPVSYRRRRGGHSKVTGTVRGTLGASVKILWSLARYSFWKPRPQTAPIR